MIFDIQTLKEFGVKIDTLSYRGFDVDFYEDVSGHQLIAIWENKLFEFGVYNTQAKEDLKLLIDEKLDTITRFDNQNDPFWYGAKLEYFDNAGKRDIRLVYRGRILNIYLDPSQDPAFLNWLKQDAKLKLEAAILRKKAEENNSK